MKRPVGWTQLALNQLAGIYVTALDRGDGPAVTAAAARVDAALEHDPDQVGESRAGRTRVMFEPPLTVYFKVQGEPPAAVVTSVSSHHRA